eukprot:c18415_g1_i1.p2 GENE.c18415_g1_i1~~c18415_g1_i1.p2  ORF type:complete len:117 (-),score=10.34 c18415_g1_i1:179-529(-)
MLEEQCRLGLKYHLQPQIPTQALPTAENSSVPTQVVLRPSAHDTTWVHIYGPTLENGPLNVNLLVVRRHLLKAVDCFDTAVSTQASGPLLASIADNCLPSLVIGTDINLWLVQSEP